MLLASSGQRPGVRLSVPQDTRQPLATKNYPAQHAKGAEAKKPGLNKVVLLLLIYWQSSFFMQLANEGSY